jgi:hypothetical protein
MHAVVVSQVGRMMTTHTHIYHACTVLHTYPVDEAVLAVGGAVAGAAAAEELEQHDAIGEDVGLLGEPLDAYSGAR